MTAMARLKRDTGKPMRSHGSISLNRALLAAGLVDFLEVTVFPAITGKAGYAALFEGGPEFDLDLVESTVLDGRTLKLVYVPRLHSAGIPEGVGPKRREGYQGTGWLRVEPLRTRFRAPVLKWGTDPKTSSAPASRMIGR